MGGRRYDDGAGARYGDLGRILIVASTSSPSNFNDSGRVVAMADAGPLVPKVHAFSPGRFHGP
jgi:hypothetical protein